MPTGSVEGLDQMRVCVAGGGTGGHIYPAVAVIDSLKRAIADLDVVFIGTRRGLESGIVGSLGYRMRSIISRPLPNRRNADFIYSCACASLGVMQSLAILACDRPHVVIGTGGYAGGPVVLAARLLGIPILLVEPNSVPGRTVTMLSKYADEIALGFKESIRYFSKGTNLRVTGVPIRSSLVGRGREAGIKRFSLDPGRKSVFVFGGSRGASSINRAVVDAVRELGGRDDLQFVVQTGQRDFHRISEAVKEARITCRVHPFIEEMGLAYAVADLVVCRAGASAVAEITANCLPAILVPYPHATAHHQESNARLLEARGAAEVILDSDLDGRLLARTIVSILSDPERLEAMTHESRVLGKPDAANEIASRLVDLARRKGRLSKLATVLADLCSVR
jgi:UDP-N-acetylglucosamine--N-acetylmuramyl-(pentapeptide) pyrophosphoryl-undecaprenol N-acetylglucosamine transferase